MEVAGRTCPINQTFVLRSKRADEKKKLMNLVVREVSKKKSIDKRYTCKTVIKQTLGVADEPFTRLRAKF